MPNPEPNPGVADMLAILRDPATIRGRSHALLARALAGQSAFFTVDLARLPDTARYVAAVIRDAYPSLEIPYHARWRHFATGGRDRWSALAAELDGLDTAEIARIRFDLCVTSVLLDAGAGPAWRFVEPGTGDVVTRSEGLAVASLHAFHAGLFAGDQGLRADAAGLRAITPEALGQAFQVTPANPLEGLAGRATLLRSLGAALSARPDLFGTEARIGRLYDDLVRPVAGHAAEPRDPAVGDSSGCDSPGRDPSGRDARVSDPLGRASPGCDTPGRDLASLHAPLAATAILAAVLEGFGPAWPERLSLDGHSLGDVWHHPDVEGAGRTAGLMPFHKLSQWLTYSLVEILEDAGIRITGLDALTGLPEYRNGGLFLDLDVLHLRDPALAGQPLPVSHPAIVEWRALTVALLDRIADPIRALLGRTAADLPLARILEGGTWAAGRRIARERRAGGAPPLSVLSDGTVF